jgi:hypothetical protein
VWHFDGRMAFVPEGRSIVARHEVPGLPGFSPGRVRRLALPKQDRIVLPAGLDILGRPKGENRIAHGLQPWDSMAFQKLTKLLLIRKFAVMLA